MIRKKTVKKKVTQRVPRTRNGGTLTEAGFWQMIRSALRNRTKYWVPKLQALKLVRRPSQNKNKRLKWEFQCYDCKQFFPQKEIESHHQQEAGSLNCAENLPLFVERLFTETGWICLCKKCHKTRHLVNNILKEKL